MNDGIKWFSYYFPYRNRNPTMICNQLLDLFIDCHKNELKSLSEQSLKMGSAGFEPTTSSAQGWHPTMLDNDPFYILKFFV
jgi:hypothetical protein